MEKEEKCYVAKGWKYVVELVEKFSKKCVEIAKNIKKTAKDDPRRVIHSLKMALALTLVSLFYYVRPLYDGFGVSGMWAVLTVVVVFEFTVGGTISKGINRGCATLTAGALGVGAHHLAILFGKQGQPIVLGFLVFLLAAMSTFTRFLPRIKRSYDYGVLIFILTFSLVAVSGYRIDMVLQLAYQRLATILVGGATCMIVSIIVCPVWAGEDLHNLVANNLEKLANFLQGFGEEYFKSLDIETSAVNTNKDSKSFLQHHKTILTSKNNEESLANFARWEPCHGRFKLHHPWKQYLKIGAHVRQCAYQIEALTGFIDTSAKAPVEFTRNIQDSCIKMSIESSKAIKAMASSIKTMTQPNSADIHVQKSKEAVEELQNILKHMLNGSQNLLTLVPDATIASILVNIVQSVEKLSESVQEFGKLAQFKGVEATDSPESAKAAAASAVVLHRGIVNPVYDGSDIVICIQEDCCTEGETQELTPIVVNKLVSPLPIVTCV